MIKARSEADAELASYASSVVGFHVSPWQVEDWRQAGALQPASHTYPGRGSTAVYSDEARSQVVEVARLSKRHRKHEDLLRVLFIRGLYVDLEALRAAFVGPLDKSLKLIGPLASERDRDRLGRFVLRAARFALRTVHGRWMQRRVAGEPDGLADILYVALHAFMTGEIPTDAGLELMLRGSGLIGLYEDQIGTLGPIAPKDDFEGLKAFLKTATLPAIREGVAQASLEELQEARTMTLLLVPFFRDFAVAVPATVGKGRAFGMGLFAKIKLDDLALASFIPMILHVMPWTKTEGAQTLLQVVREKAAAYRSLAELTQVVSGPHMSRLMAGDLTVMNELRPEVQVRVRTVAEQLAAPIGRSNLEDARI